MCELSVLVSMPIYASVLHLFSRSSIFLPRIHTPNTYVWFEALFSKGHDLERILYLEHISFQDIGCSVYNGQCFTTNIKNLTIWLKYTLHAVSINKCPWSHGSWVCRWNSPTLSILEKNKQVGFCCCCCCFKLRCQAPCSLYGPGTHDAAQTVCIPGPVAFALKVPRFRCVLLLLADAICKPEWHVNACCAVNFPSQLS